MSIERARRRRNERKRKLGAYAMKRVAAGVDLLTSLRNAQIIEPTTARGNRKEDKDFFSLSQLCHRELSDPRISRRSID